MALASVLLALQAQSLQNEEGIMKKIIAAALAALAMAACLLVLAGCSQSADIKDIQGVWKIQGSDPAVTVVFTDSEWKLASDIDPYQYTLDTNSKTLSFSSDVEEGTATYEFSDDRQQLSLTQTDDSGKTETQTFVKVSDDTSAEPTVGDTAESTEK